MNVTCYFSTLRGDDAHDGRTPNTPWRSLEKLREVTLGPGSRILLERGSVFENEAIHLTGAAGNSEAPIVLDAYGEGETLPVIHANGHGRWYQDYGRPLDNPLHVWQGWVSSAVLLFDCAWIEVRNLAVTNRAVEADYVYNDLHAMDRTGVAVVARDKGTLRHIYLKNLNVQDVDGNVYNKHMNNGGIYFTALQPENEALTGIARYEDVRVEGCYVEKVSRWGIALTKPYRHGGENVFLTVGGWAVPTSDPGSGYDIAVRGIQAALNAFDGIAGPTRLCEALLEFAGVSSPRELIPWFNQGNRTRGEIARFALAVDRCAREGDGLAGDILDSAGRDLGRYAVRLMEDLPTPRIGVYGSVLLHNRRVWQAFEAHVQAAMPGATIHRPALPPEYGAVQFAADALGIDRRVWKWK